MYASCQLDKNKCEIIPMHIKCMTEMQNKYNASGLKTKYVTNRLIVAKCGKEIVTEN